MACWLLSGLLLGGAQLALTAGEPAFGPLFQRFSLTLEAGESTEAMGPFYYDVAGDGYSEWGIPPFFARRYDVKADKLSIDILWKLAGYDQMGPESKFNIFQLLSFNTSRSLDDEGDRHFTLFPLYFQNRSDNPERDYTAVLPFYGHLRNRLLRDEVKWVMFPFYVQSRKKDVVTDNYLVPLFHLRHGDQLRGWQLWPLIGQEQKGSTLRTNVLGETEVIGPHDISFYLWPLVMKTHTGIGTPAESHQTSYLPFYYEQRSPARDVTTWLWPFFSHVVDRERDYRERGMPYPFVVFAKGPGKTSGRVWPFYGEAHNETLKTRFVLGPLYRSKEINSENLHSFRWHTLYFLFDSLDETNTETGKTFKRRGLTPLFFYTKDWNGNQSLQILAPLEPTLPHSDSLRRTLSPLWSVWRSQKNPTTGRSSQSLLWNLYRREAAPEGRRGSFLFGLVRWEAGRQGRSWQFFYLPKIQGARPDNLNPALEPAAPAGP